jgi:hypothetical protein
VLGAVGVCVFEPREPLARMGPFYCPGAFARAVSTWTSLPSLFWERELFIGTQFSNLYTAVVQCGVGASAAVSARAVLNPKS